MKKLSYRSKVIAIFIAIVGVCIGIAYAAQSYRLNVGQVLTITEFFESAKYTNTCTSDIFIPTNTATEWTAFRNNKPACITSTCVTGDVFDVPSGPFTGWTLGTANADYGESCSTSAYTCTSGGTWSPASPVPFKYCDEYGVTDYANTSPDTCNGMSTAYDCSPTETKTCNDYFRLISGTEECCMWNSYDICTKYCTTTEIFGRTVTCRGPNAVQSCTGSGSYTLANGHVYNVPSITYGSVTSVASTTTTAATVACSGNYYNYTQRFSCVNGTIKVYLGETTNTATCAANYTPSGTTCVANNVTYTCVNMPANAVANTATSYTAAFTCGASLNVNWAYLTSTCGFKCATGYGWNGSACVLGTPVNGVCGTTKNTCTAGTVANQAFEALCDGIDFCGTSTTYTWSCVGSNGGSTANCTKTQGTACTDCLATCLEAGTKILMADGTEKNIEEIQAGEKIVTYNEILKQNMTDTVLEAIHNKSALRKMFTITLDNGKTIRPNDVHSLFEVGKNGYQTINELYERFQKGETIRFQNMDGSTVRVIKMVPSMENIPVYNLHVTGIKMISPDPMNPFIGVGHSYYANGVLSHNAIFWIDQSDIMDAMSAIIT